MAYDTRPAVEACAERVRLYAQNMDPWQGEVWNRSGTPICLCGSSLWFHDIQKKKAPHEGSSCEGFVLAEVEVRLSRIVTLPVS